MTSRPMRIIKKAVPFVFIPLITLSLCEVALRLSGNMFIQPLVGVNFRTVPIGPCRPHRTRFWCLTPSYKQTEVNGKGFRGPNFSKKKPDNTYRIVCLGNSCTYGVGCDYKDSYPARLQKMFNTVLGDGAVEVINAGVPGYSSLQELRYLKEKILEYNPDMLIMQYGENDEEGNNAQQQPLSPFLFGLNNRLRTTKLFQTGYYVLYGVKKFYYDHNGRYRKKICSASYRDCRNNLLDIEACAKRNGCKVYFVTPTWCLDNRLRRISRFVNFPEIDIFTTLSGSGLPAESLYIGEHHWTAAGNAFVALAIYKTVYPSVLVDLKSHQKSLNNEK